MAVYVAPLMLPIRLALFMSVLASLSFHLARDAFLMLPTSWRRLSLQDGVATILMRNGPVLSGQVARDSVVTPLFVILRIKPDGKRWSIARVIFPDAMEQDAFRELCVRLRYL